MNLNAISACGQRAIGVVQRGAPLIDVFIRLYVAEVFFRSGLVKLGNWGGTLYLFREEYRVPLLPPEIAAVLGTAGELLLPPLLALGFATRFAALSLSVVNIVAVWSFWHVLAENEAARASHVYWGMLLLVTLFHGPGALSIDHWIKRRFGAGFR